MPGDGAAGAWQIASVRGGQGADAVRHRPRPRTTARRHQQHVERRVAAVEDRIGPAGGEQKATLVRDGGAHGVAPARLHHRVVVGDLEPERRLSRGLHLDAPQHRGRCVGARDVLQHGFEDRIGRQRDALAVGRGTLQRAGPRGAADGGHDRGQRLGHPPWSARADHRIHVGTTRRLTREGRSSLHAGQAVSRRSWPGHRNLRTRWDRSAVGLATGRG